MEKTYIGWQELGKKRNQIEYTEPTRLIGDDGELLVKGGWARYGLFEYDRTKVKPQMRGKEWDFYQVCNGKYMVQISIANISIGGYASTTLVDVSGEQHRVVSSMALWLGGKNKIVLPSTCEKSSVVSYKKGKYELVFETKNRTRTLYFRGPYKGDMVETRFVAEMFEDHQNITTVLPFEGKPTRFFMTSKVNSMPCEGYFKIGKEVIEFSKQDTFCCLDWGRVNTPYKLVWYWGNGSQRIIGDDGKEHIVGFEITWGIGDESNATETCIFYDGKAHKFGSVDVEVFPKPDKYMEPWHFISEDGRFDMTMTPKYDNHSDMNALVARMHSHQVHGLWNGTMTLDDGTVLHIKDMYAFCEYVENRW